MTPKEMYIRVTNDLSALAAHKSRKFFPEQIELALNAEVEQLVNEALKENDRGYFSIESQYYDAIQPLLESKRLSVLSDAGEQMVYIPLNALRLLDATAKGGSKGELPVSKSTVKRYTYTLGLSDGAQAPYAKSVELKAGSGFLYERQGDKGYSTPDAYQLISELTSAVENLGWEQAHGKRYNGKLVLITDKEQEYSLTIDGVKRVFTKAATQSLSHEQITRNDTIPTRRIKSQMRSEVLSTPYYKPSVKELPIFVEKNIIDLHTPDNVIVNSLLLTYIRRPQKISLSLNIGCELDPGCHAKLCDNAVQRIRERIGDPKLNTGNAI